MEFVLSGEYFQAYMGTGLIVIWFLLSLVYLFVTEKRKHVRIVFVYVPVVLLLLFFNPIFARVIYNYIGDEVYYRVLWLLPITIVIAYTAVEICGRLEGKKKTAFALLSAVLIMVSGSCIYRNPYFRKAENIYHVPQSVVEICDAIEVEGREVKAVFPAELLQYVRQYSPVVVMPYGRELTVERWNNAIGTELYAAMEAESIDAEQLARIAKQELCAYIILPEDKEIKGNLSEFDYDVFGHTEGYMIYKDRTVKLELTP